MPASSQRRLGVAVAQARTRHGWTLQDLADAAALAKSTVEHIEHGRDKQYRPLTLGKLEQALRWAPGDAQRIMDGGEPTTDPHLQHVVNSWPRLNAQVRAVIVGTVDDALSA